MNVSPPGRGAPTPASAAAALLPEALTDPLPLLVGEVAPAVGVVLELAALLLGHRPQLLAQALPLLGGELGELLEALIHRLALVGRELLVGLVVLPDLLLAIGGHGAQ